MTSYQSSNRPSDDERSPDGSGAMFDRIARRYDLLNRLTSFGLDQRWRRRLAQALGPAADLANAEVLDVATGTADVALAVARAHRATRVIGIDPSNEMLRIGRQKIEQFGVADRVALLLGDTQRLPFGDARFTACCIAFGIRNVPDRRLGLREMCRVTRPGGVVAILELSSPRHGWLRPLASWHVRHVVPAVGGWLSGTPEYRYLQRSMAAFPAADAFMQLMRDAGLDDVKSKAMGFGAVHLYTGRRASTAREA